jgi:hypothetical protein
MARSELPSRVIQEEQLNLLILQLTTQRDQDNDVDISVFQGNSGLKGRVINDTDKINLAVQETPKILIFMQTPT